MQTQKLSLQLGEIKREEDKATLIRLLKAKSVLKNQPIPHNTNSEYKPKDANLENIPKDISINTIDEFINLLTNPLTPPNKTKQLLIKYLFILL